MKFISILLLALFLTGCETSHRIWYKEGGTQDELAKDRYYCLLNSQQKVSNARGGETVEVNGQSRYITGYATKQFITNQTLFDACMNAHGWYLTEMLPLQ
jgi:hypothetical protein